MTSLMLALGSQGVWVQSPDDFEEIDIEPLDGATSPKMALPSVVLPLPTGPAHITMDPLSIAQLMS